MGTDLFDALRKFNPKGWGAVPMQFADRFRRDFEQGMQEFAQARGGNDTDVLQRAMAGYFFRFQPRGTSLYVRLADRIRETAWKGTLASLNYDRLLELSLLHSGLTPQVRGLRDSNGEIELVLPHGCCHIFVNVQVCEGIQFGSPNIKVESEDPPKRIHDPVEFQQRIETDRLPPVMCYFEPDKDVRSGPSFIKTHRRQFDDVVRNASVIGIVGVKVRPHDTHIWGPLAGTSAKLVYCAGKDAAAQFRTWSRDARSTKDHAFPTYWKDSFDAICQEVGINMVS